MERGIAVETGELNDLDGADELDTVVLLVNSTGSLVVKKPEDDVVVFVLFDARCSFVVNKTEEIVGNVVNSVDVEITTDVSLLCNSVSKPLAVILKQYLS